MSLRSPRSLMVALLALCLIFYYNEHITSAAYSYYSSETTTSESIHVHSSSSPTSTDAFDLAAAAVSESLQAASPQAATQVQEKTHAQPQKTQQQLSSASSTTSTVTPEATVVDTQEKSATPTTLSTRTSTALETYQTYDTISPSEATSNTTNSTAETPIENTSNLTPQQLAEEEYLWANNDTAFLSGSRVAVIVEDRALSNLIPLILHFSAVLGPDWPIVLFTRSSTPPPSAALLRAIRRGRVHVRALPSFVTFGNQLAVSAFLAKPWVWNQLAPADHVLVFQADSMICANSPLTIEDFVEYDLIGAPIDTTRYGSGFNGGFSLRNRNVILDIIHNNNFWEEYEQGTVGWTKFEDQWFYRKMLALPSRPDGSPGANLPAENTAKTFAVETLDFMYPLGYHQPQRWQAENMKQIEEWCPEVRLCTGRLLVNGNKTPEEIEEERLEQEAKEAQEAAEAEEKEAQELQEAIEKANQEAAKKVQDEKDRQQQKAAEAAARKKQKEKERLEEETRKQQEWEKEQAENSTTIEGLETEETHSGNHNDQLGRPIQGIDFTDLVQLEAMDESEDIEMASTKPKRL